MMVMKEIRVLIFPAGTEIALEIYRSLKYTKFVKIYGATSVDCHAQFLFENLFENVPYVKDPNFVASFNEIITKYKIDFIYPAHDDVCLELSRLQDKLKCKVITSDFTTMNICRSKIKTYDYFKNEHFIPKTFDFPENVTNFPIFIKPDIGQGSFGVEVIKTKEQLMLKDNINTYVLSEYLTGPEYTIDCFTDKDGKLAFVNMRTRERIRTGISVRSKCVEISPDVYNIALQINEKLSFKGAWFFQLKKDSGGEYKLLEVAARIAGTSCLTRNLGVNLPLLTLYLFMGINVELTSNSDKSLVVDRAFINRFKSELEYKYVYVDFDDTFYVGNKINPELLFFLYQCINKRKTIILLTKHTNDIFKDLKKYKISSYIFDDVIQIQKDDEKYKYIKHSDAIFIDDSFSERKKIRDKTGVNVYDLDMVESLIDWRQC